MEKKVLLFSGGLDSMLQEYLLKPDVLLYVDMKTSYSEREIEALHKLSKHYTDRLVIKELPLGEYERENKYLPYRNLILGTIGMEYGQHVYFGFNQTDDAPDKDATFLRRMKEMFRHLNKHCIADMGWENTHFSFSAPFQAFTKTQMMLKCLQEGMSPNFIREIRSCYSGESEKGCGECTVCFNKAVALLNCGIYTPDVFDTPITAAHFRKAFERIGDNPEDYTSDYVSEVNSAYRHLRQIKK